MKCEEIKKTFLFDFVPEKTTLGISNEKLADRRKKNSRHSNFSDFLEFHRLIAS